jgi:hypothetical protein
MFTRSHRDPCKRQELWSVRGQEYVQVVMHVGDVSESCPRCDLAVRVLEDASHMKRANASDGCGSPPETRLPVRGQAAA